MVSAVCTLSGTAKAAGTGTALDRFPASITIPTNVTCNPDPGVSMTCSLTGVSYPALTGVSVDRWLTTAVVMPTSATCNATSSAALLKTDCTLTFQGYSSLSTTTNYADRWGAASISVPTGINCSISDSLSKSFEDFTAVFIIVVCFFAAVKGWSLGNQSL